MRARRCQISQIIFWMPRAATCYFGFTWSATPVAIDLLFATPVAIDLLFACCLPAADHLSFASCSIVLPLNLTQFRPNSGLYNTRCSAVSLVKPECNQLSDEKHSRFVTVSQFPNLTNVSLLPVRNLSHRRILCVLRR